MPFRLHDVNLFFRLLWLLTVGRFRGIAPRLGPCRTSFRVLPTDLDVLMHVNNGVYLSMTDLASLNLLLRSGILRRILAKRWYPVVAAQTIQYRRSLKLGQRFDVVSRVLGWNDTSILMEHRFERNSEGVAYALGRVRLLSRDGGPVAMRDFLSLAGNPELPTDVPDYALRWYAEQEQWHGDPLSRVSVSSRAQRGI